VALLHEAEGSQMGVTPNCQAQAHESREAALSESTRVDSGSDVSLADRKLNKQRK